MSTADELRELEMGAKEALSVDRTWPSVCGALIQAQALHRLADALAPLERIAGAMEANRARGEEPMPPVVFIEDADDPRLDGPPSAAAPDQPVASHDGWRTGCPSAKQACDGWVEVRDGGQPAALPDGRMFRVQHRLLIEMGQQWAPMTLVKSFTLRPYPATPGEPTTAPSAPQEPPQAASATPGGHPLDQDGWIRSRVPTEGDGEVRVLRRDGKGSHWCHYSTVVLGQPWVRFNVRDPSSAPTPLPAHLAYPTSEGWVHDRVPWPEDGDADGDVEIAAAGVKHFDEFPDLTDRQRIAGAYIPWSHVVPGQPWRPLRTITP